MATRSRTTNPVNPSGVYNDENSNANIMGMGSFKNNNNNGTGTGLGLSVNKGLGGVTNGMQTSRSVLGDISNSVRIHPIPTKANNASNANIMNNAVKKQRATLTTSTNQIISSNINGSATTATVISNNTSSINASTLNNNTISNETNSNSLIMNNQRIIADSNKINIHQDSGYINTNVLNNNNLNSNEMEETSLEDSVEQLSLSGINTSSIHSNSKIKVNNLINNGSSTNNIPTNAISPFINVNRDSQNAQNVTAYVDDIMTYFRNNETRKMPCPSYMSRQTDISGRMREILIDWLIEVHLKFKLNTETLYLTVYLIDRFLERRAVTRTKLQLVGCTAMLLAAKYEEIYAPEVNDFVSISDKAYTRDQILAMETVMLNTLEFHLTVATAFRFAERYIVVGGGDARAWQITNYLMELQLQDVRFLNFQPSLIAASSIAIGLANSPSNNNNVNNVNNNNVNLGGASVGGSFVWPIYMSEYTGYDVNALRPCVNELLALHEVGEAARYRAVRKKYSNKKYFEVSKIRLFNPL